MNIPDTGRQAMEAMQNCDGFAGKDPEPEVLSALGAADLIGSLTAQNSLGRVLLLSQIDSPLLSDNDDDSIDILDIARGLFIMAHGAEAMQPLYSVERRLKAIKDREPKQNAELYKMWLDKVDSVAEDESAFDVAALGFLEENFKAEDFSKIQDMLISLVNENLKPLDSMPDQPETDNPKVKKSRN